MLHMNLIFPWKSMVIFIYLASNYSSAIHEADMLWIPQVIRVKGQTNNEQPQLRLLANFNTW